MCSKKNTQCILHLWAITPLMLHGNWRDAQCCVLQQSCPVDKNIATGTQPTCDDKKEKWIQVLGIEYEFLTLCDLY